MSKMILGILQSKNHSANIATYGEKTSLPVSTLNFKGPPLKNVEGLLLATLQQFFLFFIFYLI